MLTDKHHVTLIWNKFRELAAILRVTHIQANILTKARGHITQYGSTVYIGMAMGCSAL